jgi:hypothetical protein
MKNLFPFIFLFLAACAPASAPAPTRTAPPPASSAASSSAPTRAPASPTSANPSPTRSAIALANVKQTTQTDGTVRTTASVSVQENLGVGQMELASPDTMHIGEARTIRLKLSPAEQLTSLTPVPAPGKTPDLPPFTWRFSGNVQLYPIMIAELRALTFDIDRPGPQRRDVQANAPITWDWIINPRSVGQQELSIEISSPVVVNGADTQMSTSVLQNLPIIVQVQPVAPTPAPSFTDRVGESIVNNSGAIIIALIGLLGTIIGILVKMNSESPKGKK